MPLLLFFMLLPVGAGDVAPACRPASVAGLITPALSEKFELPVGGSARIASTDLTVVFEEVESDSRCPTGVTCVWEGDGVVHLCLGASPQTATSLRLHTRESASQKARHAGLVIQLVELRPYPAGDVPVDSATYRVRLVVSREESGGGAGSAEGGVTTDANR
jgi:hypothetical protein